jgi:3-dehydroquinate synthase
VTDRGTPADTVIHIESSAAGGPRPGYDVVIGTRLLDLLPETLGTGVERVALVYPDDLADMAEAVRTLLAKWYDVHDLPVPPGEAAKTATVAANCWDRLGVGGFTRSDAVVSFGGGATTDLGGFVAATWLRGVRVVHLPTTLLAMVDAAVGGKTAIDTPAGKNLVGSFHEPAGVLCDLTLLESLPPAELRSGLAEVVKCGFIADPAILDLVESADPGGVVAGTPALRELVERAIRVKAAVVAADLTETGGSADEPGREVLNYGHTMGHAIERVSDYTLRHGEAVAIGCVFAAELARSAGVLSDDVADRHRRVFERVGLPTTWANASYDELRAVMAVDKKARGSELRFVVLSGLAQPRVLAGPAEGHLRAAYRVMTEARP